MIKLSAFGRNPSIRYRTASALLAGVILAAAVAVFLPAMVSAADFTINSTADAVDANPGDGTCATASNECTLRAAIMEANALGGGPYVIDFAAATDGTPFTLALAGAGESAAATGDLDILKSLTLVGNGPASTIIQAGASAAAGIDRVFEINPNGNELVAVTLQNMTIRHGHGTDAFGGGISFWGCSNFTGFTCPGGSIGNLTLNNVHLTDNVSAGATFPGGGGGLLVEDGDVTIAGSVISNNQAPQAYGGGINAIGNYGSLSIADSSIASNSAAQLGGGVFFKRNVSGALTVTGGSVTNNTAGGRGGGIYVEATGTATVETATVAGNVSGAEGGGIYSSVSGSVTMTAVTIANNTAGSGAGRGGGGVAHNAGVLTIVNSTISGNSAVGTGGGLVSAGNPTTTATLVHVTVTNNRAGTGGGVHDEAGNMALQNTIVAGNFQGAGSTADDVGGTLDTAGSAHNLIGAGGSGGLSDGVSGNLVGVSDPGLGPLAANGGPTQTHALLDTSPAIDAGHNSLVPGGVTTDQRGAGFPRHLDGDGDTVLEVDIGAYEINVQRPDLGLTKSAGVIEAAPGDTLVYTLSYTNTGTADAADVVITEELPAQTSFNAGGSDAWACVGNTCTLAIGTVAQGGGGTATFAVIVATPVAAGVDVIANTASIAGTGAETVTGNNSASATVTLNAQPDLSITKDDGGVIGAPGSTVTYNVAFANTGNQDATGVVVTDTVPNYSTFDAGNSDPRWVCAGTAGGSVCTLSLSSLAAGASDSAAFTVQVDAVLPSSAVAISNTAGIDDDHANGADPTPGNNSATDTTPTQRPTTTSVSDAAGQYSDVVTLTATVTADVDPDHALGGTVEFFVNSNFAGAAAIDSGGVATLDWAITLPADSAGYAIYAQFDADGAFYQNSAGSGTLTVTREDALVAAAPVSAQVSTASGTATATVTAQITEVGDSSAGDVANAVPVTFIFTPVGASSTPVCASITYSGGGAGGTLTATCTLKDVEVNVYDVAITVGGDYYTGSGATVLTVYDPSLGSVTGGGTLIHNGYDVKFGFNVKYLSNGEAQGSLLVIEQRPDGDVKTQSESMTSLSLVGNEGVFQGTAALNGVSGYSFRARAIDNGEPGSSDQFGLRVLDPNGSVVADLTYDPIALSGGNIKVPQK